jgi:hypothetical protein
MAALTEDQLLQYLLLDRGTSAEKAALLDRFRHNKQLYATYEAARKAFVSSDANQDGSMSVLEMQKFLNTTCQRPIPLRALAAARACALPYRCPFARSNQSTRRPFPLLRRLPRLCQVCGARV